MIDKVLNTPLEFRADYLDGQIEVTKTNRMILFTSVGGFTRLLFVHSIHLRMQWWISFLTNHEQSCQIKYAKLYSVPVFFY